MLRTVGPALKDWGQGEHCAYFKIKEQKDQGAVIGPKNSRQYPSCEATVVSQGYPSCQLKLTVDIFNFSVKPHVKPHLVEPQETCMRQKASCAHEAA